MDLIGIQGVSIPQEYWYDGEQCREKQLKPNKKHLHELIKYASEKDFGNAAYATIRNFVLKFTELGLLTAVPYGNRTKYSITI